MNQTVVFTADVIRQLNNLPESERSLVANALVNHYILGKEVDAEDLSPMQSIIFCMLSSNVCRASASYARRARS